jgi:hypothetical protein
MSGILRPLVLAALLATSAGTTLAPSSATAKEGFSLGMILGDPSGLTLRGGVGGPHAIQAHFGFGFFPGDAVTTVVDWTYDAWDFLRGNSTASLVFYFGLGGKLMWFTGRHFTYERNKKTYFDDYSHFGFGFQGLVGLRAVFRRAPFDVFFELAPMGLTVVVPDPGAYYDLDCAIGFRYRF